MPTYFFHTEDGVCVLDQVGTGLPDDARAFREAVRLAGAVMHDEPERLWGGRTFRTEVVSETGEPLFTVVVQAVAGAAPMTS